MTTFKNITPTTIEFDFTKEYIMKPKNKPTIIFKFLSDKLNNEGKISVMYRKLNEKTYMRKRIKYDKNNFHFLVSWGLTQSHVYPYSDNTKIYTKEDRENNEYVDGERICI